MKKEESLWLLRVILGDDYSVSLNALVDLHPTLNPRVVVKDFELDRFQLTLEEALADAKDKLTRMDADQLLEIASEVKNDALLDLFLHGLFRFLDAGLREKLEADLLAYAKEQDLNDGFYGGLYAVLPIILQYATERKRDVRIEEWTKSLIRTGGFLSKAFEKYWTERLRWYAKKKDWARVMSDLKGALAWASLHQRLRKDFVDIIYFAMLDKDILVPQTDETPRMSSDERVFADGLPDVHKGRFTIVRATSLHFQRRQRRGKRVKKR